MQPARNQHENEDGFLLVAVIVAVFLVLLALSIAAPRMAIEIKRDREQETRERANQYTRAIQLYYRKFKNYPSSMDQLKKSNNVRFLRQEYVDPMTGQKDWKLIHVGENKTHVKGFFGEDLPGIAGASGLSAIGGSGSNTGGPGDTLTSTNSPFTIGSPTPGGSSFGSNGSPGTTSGATGNSSGTGGVSSQSATTFGGSGGAFMGVGVPKDGEALMTVNEQTNYQDWEFLYDPRIEALRAKSSLIGGINSGSGTSPAGGLKSLTPDNNATPKTQ